MFASTNASQADAARSNGNAPDTATAALLSQGLEHHQSGDLTGAAARYREALAHEPESPDALYLLGLIAHQTDRPSDAVPLLRQAIARDNANVDYRMTLGLALAATGDLKAAEDIYRESVGQTPDMVSAHTNLGDVLLAQGETIEAVASYWRALRLNGDVAETHCNLGAAFHALGQEAAAEEHLKRACRLNPELPSARENLKQIHQNFRADGHQPTQASVQFERGIIFNAAGLLDDAESELRSALSEEPDSIIGLFALANTYKENQHFDEAIETFETALAIDSQAPELHSELGVVFAAVGRLDEAEASLRRAIECDAQAVDAHKNLGNILLEQGRHDEALSAYDAALAIQPDHVSTHNNRANLLLLLGRYAAGWDEYEWRRRMPNNAPQQVALPDWTGEPLDGRRLHVIGEQAAGDATMFATCVPELANAGGPVTMHCEARIASLMARSFPWLEVTDALPLAANESQGAAAVAIPLGSLPRLLRADEAGFGRSEPYLVADEIAVARWRARYAALGSGPKIGFSWRGGKSAFQRRQRSMALLDWLPVLRHANACFIDLQYGEHDEERNALREAHGIAPYRPAEIDPMSDMDGFAAQVAALDLVISIDNTSVHFAGALGVPVWTLAPVAPSWRWQLTRSDSPWYPSMRLVRQQKNESWPEVLTRVAADLETWLAQIEPAKQ